MGTLFRSPAAMVHRFAAAAPAAVWAALRRNLWYLVLERTPAVSSVAVADFAPKSATFGLRPTNGSSLSRLNILRNRFFGEVV